MNLGALFPNLGDPPPPSPAAAYPAATCGSGFGSLWLWVLIVLVLFFVFRSSALGGLGACKPGYAAPPGFGLGGCFRGY